MSIATKLRQQAGRLRPADPDPADEIPHIHREPPRRTGGVSPERMATAARWMSATISRPRVRLAAAGTLLVIAGAWVVSSSVWTLALIVVGVVMILIAWFGARLEGRFTVDWGADGSELQLYARLKPARAAVAVRPASETETIESSAHTVEIDVAELTALIAAAQVGDAPAAEAGSAGAAVATPQESSDPCSVSDPGRPNIAAAVTPTTHRLAS